MGNPNNCLSDGIKDACPARCPPVEGGTSLGMQESPGHHGRGNPNLMMTKVCLNPIKLRLQDCFGSAWRFMGSCKWGYQSPNMGYTYTHLTYNST